MQLSQAFLDKLQTTPEELKPSVASVLVSYGFISLKQAHECGLIDNHTKQEADPVMALGTLVSRGFFADLVMTNDWRTAKVIAFDCMRQIGQAFGLPDWHIEPMPSNRIVESHRDTVSVISLCETYGLAEIRCVKDSEIGMFYTSRIIGPCSYVQQKDMMSSPVIAVYSKLPAPLPHSQVAYSPMGSVVKGPFVRVTPPAYMLTSLGLPNGTTLVCHCPYCPDSHLLTKDTLDYADVMNYFYANYSFILGYDA